MRNMLAKVSTLNEAPLNIPSLRINHMHWNRIYTIRTTDTVDSALKQLNFSGNLKIAFEARIFVHNRISFTP